MDIDGIDLTPLLILLGIVFLIGFAVILVPSLFLIRRLKERPRTVRIPIVVLSVLLSVSGGFLAVRMQVEWDQAQERAFNAERRAFTQKMAQQYPLQIEYHPDQPYDQQFVLNFSVPASGYYSVHVFGLPAGEILHQTLLGDAIIKVHKYGLLLEVGNNEITIGFPDDNSATQTNQNLDFIVIIQPEIVHEKLLDVRNSGAVELTDGINFYSSYLYGGCLSDIYVRVPCVEDDHLHIEISK